MELPIRFSTGRTDELQVSVDGAWNQPGLNLSHWPGNTTPRELAHDLSTGVALHFARLPRARRDELARGCTSLANNHFDSDGVCALFAVRHPERALARAEPLLDLAAAGDFFRWPSDRALAQDLVIAGLVDPERSPWSARFAGLDDAARYELVMNELVDRLDDVLDGDLERFAPLWTPGVERARADRTRLASASRDDLVHLDLVVWIAPRGEPFLPGRHAMSGTSDADRLLALQERGGGCTARLVLNTSSWFDLQTPRLPRPSLETLAQRLNELEGCALDAGVRWRCEPTASPSPELWFGREGKPWFAEHSSVLEESRLPAVRVRALVVEALREAWVFPDE